MINIFYFFGGMLLQFIIERSIRLVYKKFLNQKYQVVCFSRELEADGTYKIWFRHPCGRVVQGYTKKCPPKNILPSELMVKVRTYNLKRLKYRVFWEKR